MSAAAPARPFADANPWAALVGRRSDGRGSVLGGIVAALQQAGLRVGGFAQEPVRSGEEIIGWDARDLNTGERCAVARPSDTPDVCTWGIDEAGLARCRRWVGVERFDVVVVEIGMLEAGGGGHWPVVRDVLVAPALRLALLSLRPHVLARVALALPDPVAGLELPASPGTVEEFVTHIREELPSVTRGVGSADESAPAGAAVGS